MLKAPSPHSQHWGKKSIELEIFTKNKVSRQACKNHLSRSKLATPASYCLIHICNAPKFQNPNPKHNRNCKITQANIITRWDQQNPSRHPFPLHLTCPQISSTLTVMVLKCFKCYIVEVLQALYVISIMLLMLYYCYWHCVIPQVATQTASQSASSFHLQVYKVELLAWRLFFFMQYFVNQAYIYLEYQCLHYIVSLS